MQRSAPKGVHGARLQVRRQLRADQHDDEAGETDEEERGEAEQTNTHVYIYIYIYIHIYAHVYTTNYQTYEHINV